MSGRKSGLGVRVAGCSVDVYGSSIAGLSHTHEKQQFFCNLMKPLGTIAQEAPHCMRAKLDRK